MNLQEDLTSFMGWLKRHACPGFREYVADTYYDKYEGITVEEKLMSIADEMKEAVTIDSTRFYQSSKSDYKELFDDANKRFCVSKYDQILKDLSINTDLTTFKAREIAVERAWEYPYMRYWLPIYVLLKDEEDNEVYLVARKVHAPRGKNYVTISELSEIEGTELNPWKFVKERKAA